MVLNAAPMSDIRPGTAVEVRNRFDGRWSKGFEVVDVDDDGRYLVRRQSDGTVLPVALATDDVRKERRRETWWV